MSKFLRRTNIQPQELIKDPIDSDLFIDSSNLNEEVMNQPLKYSKWIKLKSEASSLAKVLKLQLKQREAELHLKHSQKGVRVADVAAMVTLEPEIIELNEKLIEAEELLSRYEGFVRAFHQRHEALKDLCANTRKELV